jgi:hypothetical protein
MAVDRNDSEERQARLDWMMEEFRAAQQRRVVKAGIALRNRTEAAQQAMASVERPPRDKAH